jgi:outer membrane protein OmpA-like peptidoglycan-associated protein
VWAAAAALAVVPAVGAVGLIDPLYIGYSAGVVAVSVLTIWLTAGAMSQWPSAKGVGWTLFAAIAFWSGSLGFLRERGARHPELEVAFVKSSSGDWFKGFFLGRTSDHVYLASTTPKCDDEACRRVLIVADDKATCLAFGPSEPVPRKHGDTIPTVRPQLTAFKAGSSDLCEPEPSKSEDTKPTTSTTHTERNLSLDVDLHFAPRRSVVVRRPRRDVSLDFDFDASPRLSLFSGASRARGRVLLASEIFFRFEDDRLTLGARRKLRNLVRWMRRTRPKWVFVYGHADEHGSPDDNQELSNRRAWAVRRALVRRRAVNRSQVPMASLGEASPAVCGRGRKGFDDPRSRVYNRRVEIYTGEAPAASDLRCPRQRR